MTDQTALEPVAWRPIETAPKDGSMILYGAKDWVSQGRWVTWEREWRELNNDPSDNWGGPDHPTHWMPLPPPPGSATPPDTRALLDEAREAMADLLQDTQHIDHNCGDGEWCPVIKARATLAKLEALK